MERAQDAGADLELSARIGFGEHALHAEVGGAGHDVGKAADQIGLGSEVEVDSRERNASQIRHSLHRGCTVSALLEQRLRGLEDRKLGPVALVLARG
jgi:hypothetical protein